MQSDRDEFQSATLMNGLPTCSFPAKSYRRIITVIEVTNSVASAVSCHRGVLASPPVAQSLLGSTNTFVGRIVLPAGQPFYVQWALAGALVNQATAKISFDIDDNPSTPADSSSGSWTGYAVANINPTVTETVDVMGTIANGTTIIGGSNRTLFDDDVRSFKSFYLRIDASITGAPNYNAVRIGLQWFAADPQGSSSFEVLREDMEFWASTASPGANQDPVLNGSLFYQDRMHASRLLCVISNPMANTITLNNTILYGTTRELVQSWQELSPFGDTLVQNNNIPVPAGGDYYIPLPMYYGRMGIHRENIGAGAPTVMNIRWGSNTNDYAYHSMVSNAVDGNPTNFEIVAPRRAGLVRLRNNGAATTNRLFITTQRDRI